MRLFLQLVAAVLATVAVGAQQAGTSPKPSDPASTSGPPAPQADTPSSSNPPGELPVSLDRIREGLAKPAPGSTIKRVELKADFVVHVEERDHFLKILDSLKIESGPAPLGGIRAQEQRERAFPKTEKPLMQPYAAFSGGELLTLAIEGLVQKYLGGALINAVSNAQRASAERAARQEVASAIVEYCDAQPDGGRSLHLCTEMLDR